MARNQRKTRCGTCCLNSRHRHGRATRTRTRWCDSAGSGKKAQLARACPGRGYNSNGRRCPSRQAVRKDGEEYADSCGAGVQETCQFTENYRFVVHKHLLMPVRTMPAGIWSGAMSNTLHDEMSGV